MDPFYLLFHSKFKDLSNDTSQAQFRVKMKKLWPQQVVVEKQELSKNYVAKFPDYVATKPTKKPETLSRQR